MDWDCAEDMVLAFPAIFRHYKGEWVGKPIELCDFQIFVTANILGWKHRSTKLRRFRRAFVSVARKNGKTTWAAGLAILLAFFDGEAAAEVYIGATKREQAGILFSDAKSMLQSSSTLSRHSKSYVSRIEFPATHSLIRPLGSDRQYDGLNPHAVFMDEIHAMTEQHRKFYDTMRTGGGARRQPLLCEITTAGDNKSELWKEAVSYCKMILDGTADDDQVFAFIAEIDEGDDPFDESIWVKANPGLGASIKLDYLREQSSEAKSNPTALNRFMRYHCNTMVSSIEQAIDMDQWDVAGTGLSNWQDADTVAAGFDLGGRDDLASYGLVARFQIGEDEKEMPVYRYECRQRSFMFTDTRRDLHKQPWAEWVQNETLSLSKFAIDDLRDSLVDDCEELGIEDIAFDPHQALMLANQLEQLGFRPIKMPQNYFHFNEPIRSFLQALTDGRFTHSGSDSLMRFCASNAVIVKDRADRWMLDKGSSKDKIDPVVAMIMAFRACMAAKSRATGSYFIV
jgi:phage terminase large subunit-like protein